MRSSARTKTRHVILDFDMVSEIITFEDKGRFGKEKHQNFGVKVKVVVIEIMSRVKWTHFVCS